MTFPERFSDLPAYAFPRLRALLGDTPPGSDPISMSIGEPTHAFPSWVGEVLAQSVSEFGKYPPNEGSPELLNSIAGWLSRRHGIEVQLDRQIMALNGTREGLFNAAIALCPEVTDDGQQPAVLVPNPFYQVYAVAALTVGAEPIYLNATAENGFLPDYSAVPAGILNRTKIAYICTPSNPQGAVASREYLANLIQLAERHDFYVFSDECYSEIYSDEPPLSALAVAQEMGASPERVVVFNSLSKRSNVPGLRSGFVAGGPASMQEIKKLRAYAGAPLSLPMQRVAERLWADEEHVAHNRTLYQEKYQLAEEIFSDVAGVEIPKAGFFLWLPVENGEDAALKAWTETGARVLPGEYLSRDVDGTNPGKKYIRVAMVAGRDELQDGLMRLRTCLYA